jgi:D-3-phosphoglycerate dehydrogenase
VTYRVAISPSSFAAEDEVPLRLLREAGVEIVPNPFGRRLTEDEALRHLEGVDGLVAGLEPLTRRVLAASPRLKAIARVGIGMDNVDLEAARELGIRVSNTPDAPSRAVAEMTVAAALALSRNLVGLDRAMHEGRWEKTISPGLWERSVLLIGLGRIGRSVASLLRSFGARVSAVDPHLSPDEFGDIPRTTLEDGLPRAEVVSVHAAGRAVILGPAEFSRMADGVLLLNCARAELVDEQALVEALDSGKVSGAWFDVFWDEPYGGRLKEYGQVLLTPHVGTYTAACRREMETAAVRNLLQDLRAAERAQRAAPSTPSNRS